MKYAVVYDSITGNTEMLAKEIKHCLEQGGLDKMKCVYFGSCEGERFLEQVEMADRIFAGFWTDKGDCSARMTAFFERIHEREIFLFGTAGFGGSPAYFRQIEERVGKHISPDNTIIGTYMCQGKMPLSVRNRYEALLEKNPEDEKMEDMIRNFDQALVHPDQKDMEKLRDTLKTLKGETLW